MLLEISIKSALSTSGMMFFSRSFPKRHDKMFVSITRNDFFRIRKEWWRVERRENIRIKYKRYLHHKIKNDRQRERSFFFISTYPFRLVSDGFSSIIFSMVSSSSAVMKNGACSLKTSIQISTHSSSNRGTPNPFFSDCPFLIFPF